MRIKAISLGWFRGAGPESKLVPNSKSLVVYGANASGKSSFVDAWEHAVTGGRVDHLGHEYSGARQEKGLINTHKPTADLCNYSIVLDSGPTLVAEIQDTGSCTWSPISVRDDIQRVVCSRSVLRQQEISRFIVQTKAEKFSTVIPLLGLGAIEQVAVNARTLLRVATRDEELTKLRGELPVLEQAAKRKFAKLDVDSVVRAMQPLAEKYLSPEELENVESKRLISIALQNAIQNCLDGHTVETQRLAGMVDIGNSSLAAAIARVRTAATNLAASVPNAAKILPVVEAAIQLGDSIDQDDTIACPACGTNIDTKSFKSHIESEKRRLKLSLDALDEYQTACRSLTQDIFTLRRATRHKRVGAYLEAHASKPITKACEYLRKLDENNQPRVGAELLEELEAIVLPLVEAGRSEGAHAPPSIRTLTDDKDVAVSAASALDCIEKSVRLSALESLVDFVRHTEEELRALVAREAQKRLGSISTDVKRLWKILNPESPIESIELYQAADKAMDVRFKFYGVDQNSPRNTLSEGYRNGLGICFFLAMARSNESIQAPVFLDDIVLSLDREHRGRLSVLLRDEFQDRQLIVFTHDRDWFAELKHILPPKNWEFSRLLPFQSPAMGIQTDTKVNDFDIARSQLPLRSDGACNDARKTMDQEMMRVAENLGVRVPYRRWEQNEKRGAAELIDLIVSDANTKFQCKDAAAAFVSMKENLGPLLQAKTFLIPWGNTASHAFDGTSSEAKTLIDTCEAAMSLFKCRKCSEPVWFASIGRSGSKQCQCGDLRWKS